MSGRICVIHPDRFFSRSERELCLDERVVIPEERGVSLMRNPHPVWFLAFFFWFFALYYSVQYARADATIRVGVPASQTSAIPIHIGAERGIFAKYGLRVEPIVIPSGRVNISALISGNTEFISGSSPELFFVGEQGGDIIGIGCWDNSSPYNLISREKLRSLKDLRGKTVAAGGFMDKSHLFLKLLLSHARLEPEKDVDTIFISGSSARLSMLASGKITKDLRVVMSPLA